MEYAQAIASSKADVAQCAHAVDDLRSAMAQLGRVDVPPDSANHIHRQPRFVQVQYRRLYRKFISAGSELAKARYTRDALVAHPELWIDD